MAQGGDGFQCHVAGPLIRPFPLLLQYDAPMNLLVGPDSEALPMARTEEKRWRFALRRILFRRLNDSHIAPDQRWEEYWRVDLASAASAKMAQPLVVVAG
jgi:hypothetical protein